MNDWTRSRIDAARAMLARIDAGQSPHPDAPSMAGNWPYIAGALRGRLESLADAIEAEPTWPVWTRCEDGMPPMIPATLNDYRQESEYVLVRAPGYSDAPVLARWTRVDEDEFIDGLGAWIQQGRDGYEIDHVVEWREVGP